MSVLCRKIGGAPHIELIHREGGVVEPTDLLGAFKGCPAAEYTPFVRSFDMVSPQIARTRAV